MDWRFLFLEPTHFVHQKSNVWWEIRETSENENLVSLEVV